MNKLRASYRYFVLIFIILMLVYAVTNYIIWIMFTRELLVPKTTVSDIVRLSYLVKIRRHDLETGVDLPKRHIEIAAYNNESIDMVTVGDSFSIGGGGGRNPYYQDYIASKSDLKVLNIPNIGNIEKTGFFDPVYTLAILYNSGMLDRIKPRYVLLESVDKYAIDRLVTDFRFDYNQPLDKLWSYYKNYKPKSVINKENNFFINSGNMSFIRNNIKDLMSKEEINSVIYKVKLSKVFFSGEYGDRLYYLRDDYTLNAKMTKDNLLKLNDNLNYISDLLAKKNIKLVFMPIVNKLSLYGSYAVSPQKENIFFEEMRGMIKRYEYIDTKSLLLDELQKGVKDIYFKDDSHWSWKASEKVFNSVSFN